MKRILIVDDQPDIREMIHHALRDSFELEMANNADQAYEQIMIAIPDAIVLDVMMPGTMDGYQLCEVIKKDPKLAGILVVLITACGQVADQELGRTLGADAYFVKPFSPLQLERYLKDVLLAGQAAPDHGWKEL
jgi:CheY-like chemotaxis protein